MVPFMVLHSPVYTHCNHSRGRGGGIDDNPEESHLLRSILCEVILDRVAESIEIPDVFFEEPVGDTVIDCSVTMDHDIPERFHPLDCSGQFPGYDALGLEVCQDILVLSRNSERQVGIQYRTDIQDVLDGKLDFFVYPVFYEAQSKKSSGVSGRCARTSATSSRISTSLIRIRSIRIPEVRAERVTISPSSRCSHRAGA